MAQKEIILLNTHGIALKIFLDFGKFSFPIKMSVEATGAFAIEKKFRWIANLQDRSRGDRRGRAGDRRPWECRGRAAAPKAPAAMRISMRIVRMFVISMLMMMVLMTTLMMIWAMVTDDDDDDDDDDYGCDDDDVLC